jgi:hypothetical protein
MPGLVKLRREHKDIEVVGWHVGKGTKEDVERLVKAKGVDYPVVMSAGFDEVKAWGHRKIPSAAVVDGKGKVRWTDLKPAVAEERAVRLLDGRGP